MFLFLFLFLFTFFFSLIFLIFFSRTSEAASQRPVIVEGGKRVLSEKARIFEEAAAAVSKLPVSVTPKKDGGTSPVIPPTTPSSSVIPSTPSTPAANTSVTPTQPATPQQASTPVVLATQKITMVTVRIELSFAS